MAPGWAASRWMSLRDGIVAGGFEGDGSSVARADPSLARNHNRHHISPVSMHRDRLRRPNHKVSLSFTSLLDADLLPFPLLPDPMPRLRTSRSHASTLALDDGEEGEISVPIKRSELRSIVPCASPPSDETAQRPFPELPLPFLARLTHTEPSIGMPGFSSEVADPSLEVERRTSAGSPPIWSS